VIERCFKGAIPRWADYIDREEMERFLMHLGDARIGQESVHQPTRLRTSTRRASGLDVAFNPHNGEAVLWRNQLAETSATRALAASRSFYKASDEVSESTTAKDDLAAWQRSAGRRRVSRHQDLGRHAPELS